MSSDLERAQGLLDHLAQTVGTLAHLIAVPASGRDRAGLEREWLALTQQRASLNSIYRKLRKHLREQGSDRGARDLPEMVKRLSWHLQLWDEMDALLAKHLDPPVTELNLDCTTLTADPLLNHIYAALHSLAKPNMQNSAALAHDCFADIPMELQNFDLLLQAAYRLLLVEGRAETARFLDVGCGGATKVMAATRLFPKADGLEYDLGYAEAGQHALGLAAPGVGEVFAGDALQFNGYGAYDVIYFYRPIKNDTALRKMHQRIVDQARPGTVILAPYARLLAPLNDFPAAQIKGPIFVTGVSQQEADLWHENAKHTGTERLRRSGEFRHDPEAWSALIDAASVKGTEALDEKFLLDEDNYTGFKAAVM